MNPQRILFGLTPPKITTPLDKVHRIAQKTSQRIQRMNPDKIVIYDIQDESKRNPIPRPFPFIHTHEPLAYARILHDYIQRPMILYKCVVNHSVADIKQWLDDVAQTAFQADIVLVGGQSSSAHIKGCKLSEAYQLYQQGNYPYKLGGVAIAERHMSKRDEHRRIMRKMEAGCSFFITQAVYNIDYSLAMMRDLLKTCGSDMPNMLFTLTPCGNEKTIHFMDWLGIHMTEDVKRRILSAEEPATESAQLCIEMAQQLCGQFGTQQIGFNIESVSKRKVEIRAAEYLATALLPMLCEEPSGSL